MLLRAPVFYYGGERKPACKATSSHLLHQGLLRALLRRGNSLMCPRALPPSKVLNDLNKDLLRQHRSVVHEDILFIQYYVIMEDRSLRGPYPANPLYRLDAEKGLKFLRTPDPNAPRLVDQQYCENWMLDQMLVWEKPNAFRKRKRS